MSPPPRRLTFAVGSSLLTAALSLGPAGCDDDAKSNPKAPDQDSDGEPEHTINEAPEPEPEPDRVNEGPEPDPEPEPVRVNEGPQPTPPPTPEPAPEKHVNTVAPSK